MCEKDKGGETVAKRLHTQKAATPINFAVFKKKKGGSINCGEFSFSQHLTFSINNFIFKRGSETLSEALADVLFEKVDDCNGICETTDITGVKITPLSF